ncbi:MAG: sigma-54 dependent transcriptional regulator [Rhodothermales bacterium]|nr:sigma-54 dependent transcriptional regulator [Rhodothermales bacterium]
MMSDFGSLLIVDDDADVLQAARLLLKKHARRVHTENRPERIPELLQNETYDIILLDMNFTRDVASGREGFFWLDKILAIDPAAVVVLITAFGDVEMAVNAIKAGATDFVLKPWQNEKLLATLTAARRLRSSRAEAGMLRDTRRQLMSDMDQRYQDFVGESPAMQRVFEQIDKVADTDASVLILGENGTGKELVARALHRHSLRAEHPFVGVDMGAVADTLFESELFGHVRGAFTDAREDRMGRFEMASKGTLFLDEIGNLSLAKQSKLLTSLQQREIVRIGSNKPVPIDVRLICATNMPLYEMVDAGTFRQDLLYRFNTVEIHLPPLRERPEDIEPLANHFLQRFARKYGRPVHALAAAAIAQLKAYHMPGNVRELEHMIERAVIMTESNTLQREDFFFAGTRKPDAEGLVFDAYNLEEVERTVIRKALDKHEGNISKAAKELGLTRAALYRRLEKYRL